MSKKNIILFVIQSVCVGFFLKFLQDWVHNDDINTYIAVLVLFFGILITNREFDKSDK